jgi:hypothetical protein
MSTHNKAITPKQTTESGNNPLHKLVSSRWSAGLKTLWSQPSRKRVRAADILQMTEVTLNNLGFADTPECVEEHIRVIMLNLDRIWSMYVDRKGLLAEISSTATSNEQRSTNIDWAHCSRCDTFVEHYCHSCENGIVCAECGLLSS